MTHRQNFTQYRHRCRNRAQRKTRHLFTEALETRTLLAGDLLQNPLQSTDVNSDGVTSPLDALHVINELNSTGARSSRALAATAATGATAATAQPRLFYDVNGDDYLTPMDALVVLNELNAEGEDDDLVQIRLEVTDAGGNVLDAVDVGQPFQLRAYVQDLTGRTNGGVFAAYLDVEYDASVIFVSGNISHSPSYGNAKSGDIATPGLIDEVGSIDGLTPLGPDELLLFTVPMASSTSGAVTFTPNAADVRPAHDVLVFGVPTGEPNSVVAPDRITFIGTTLQVGQVSNPVAGNDQYQTPQGQTLVVTAANGVLKNDTNTAGGTLSAVLVDEPLHGDLVLGDDGAFSYTPDANFSGTDTFTYLATNGELDSNVATVTITVTPVNRPPVAGDDEYITDEDELLDPLDGVLFNDSDPDDDTLTVRLIAGPTHGTLDLETDGTFTYMPAADYHGSDSFRYVANDGQVDSNQATVTIGVQPVNDLPETVADAYSVSRNGTLVVNAASGVLANDSDPDGDDLTAALVAATQHGDLILNADGSFSYTPDQDYSGEDIFTYVANDGTAASAVTTVTLTVGGDFQVRFRLETASLFGAPISTISPGGEFLLRAFVQDISALPQDGVFAAYMDVLYTSALVSIDGPIQFNPVYPNQQTGNTAAAGLIDEAGAFDGLTPLGASERLLFSVPFVANQAGVVDFAADPADLLPAHDTLLYNVNQAVSTGQIEYGSVQLTIEQGNPPVAVADSYETDEDTQLDVNAAAGVLANDSDPDDNPLSAVLVDSTDHGTLNLNLDGSFVYQPSANFVGTDTFTYRASDGALFSNTVTVTIEVNPIDDAPLAVDDEYLIDDLGSLSVPAAEGVLANDSDPDGDSLSAVLVDGPAHGSLDLDADGSFTYVPEVGFVGQDTFTYRAVAGDRESNVATVRINVGDLRPSSIHGVVYVDTDNDGVVDSHEYRIGGIQVTLTGVDLLGNPVDLSTVTDGDGAYHFTNVRQGRYTLTQFQAQYMVDGYDTHAGELSWRNDRFQIDLPAATVAEGYNFGERGLEPRFIHNPWFFASRDAEYLMTMVDPAGRMMWYVLDAGWDGFASVSVKLSGNRSSVEITATDDAGQIQTTTVRVVGNPNAMLSGDTRTGYLLKINGGPEDHGLSDPAEGEPLSASAVDAVFTGPDA